MKSPATFCLLVIVISLSLSSALAVDNNLKTLKTVVNSKGYMVADPAISWPYPGGFLVANNKTATFIDLPDGISKPIVQDVTADFFAEKQNKKFSLSAILTGMASLIGGNPGAGFGNTSNLNFQELKASGSRITYAQALSILNNDSSQPTIKKWLSTKNNRVFIVASVLTSNKLSITADHTWNADVSFNGSSVSKCADSNSSNSSNSGSSDNATAGAANVSNANGAQKNNSPSAVPPAPNSPAAPNQQSSKPSKNQQSTSSATNGSSPSAQPGGELHVCSSNSTTISMNTDSQLVFAASAYEVTLDKSTGALNIDPILGPSPSGTFEEHVISQKANPTAGNDILKKIKANWQRQAWQ